MPTSTDLVTDLPADFEVFGQAVDTSLADLKGGTTGQVLSKASNTNMDFTWVTSDDANAIQNSIVDAKGDLIAASANDTPARLAVGNNGETLVADSSTSTGLRYQGSMAAARNFVNNGGFDIWQRGTSFASPANNSYSADRWCLLNGGSATLTLSRQATGDTTNLPFIQYCMRFQRNSGQTNTGPIYLTQSLESVNSIPLAGRTVVLSFYARAGANFSSTSNLLQATVSSGTGTDQNINSGFTGSATVINQNATLTTTWQRFTYTGTVGATATQLGLYFIYTPTGTAGAADFFEVTGVQLELGSVATTFSRQGGTIQGELSAAQRYYVRFGGSSTYEYLGYGIASGTSNIQMGIRLPVTMRVEPTAVDYSTLIFTDEVNPGIVPSSITLISTSSGKDTAYIQGAVSGATSLRPYELLTNNSTSGYIGFTAEL